MYQTQSAINSGVSENLTSRKIDITSPAIASVLESLAAVDETIEAESSMFLPTDLLVKIPLPLYIRVTPPGPVHPRALFRFTEMVESFMTAWTVLVGDPVLSRWIVLVLSVSVALNDYILKGIAEGAMRGLQPNIFDSGRWSQRIASNDEEVIMLAQNGKIQAYALEKVIGDLERAVTIRRALICKSSLVCH